MSVNLRRWKWLYLLIVACFVLLYKMQSNSVKEHFEQVSSQSDFDRTNLQSGGFETEARKIALTFDDGPNDRYTEPLLEGLKERNVKATFFLIGNEVLENPEIARRIAEDGHLIGNHSFYHVDLSKLSEEEARVQITRTNEVIYEVTGQYPQLLRPPFGRIPSQFICEPPMIEVLWTIDSRDWELDDVGTVVMNVLPNAEENAIILMHDASATSVAAALSIVDSLLQEGYIFVTLDEILFV